MEVVAGGTRMPAARTLPHACVPRRMLIMHARRLFDLARSYSIGNWYLIDLGYAIRFLDTRGSGQGKPAITEQVAIPMARAAASTAITST